MTDRILRIARNQRLVSAVHWAVLALGVVSLVVSIGASAAVAV